jgi:MFS family permease
MKTIPKPLVLASQWTIVLSVVIALITQNGWILFLPLISCLLSVFFGFHPIMLIVKRFLKKPLNQYLQEDLEQLQFNQWMALSFLLIAVVSFVLDWKMIFNVATIMVGMAALVAILGFCIGCFIRFHFQQWQYRRKKVA